MYKIIKTISAIARLAICYVTIESIQIFADPVFNYVLSGAVTAVLYLILYGASFAIVGIMRKNFGIDSSAISSLLYLIIYCILLLPIWGLMKLFVFIGWFPIVFSIGFEEWITQVHLILETKYKTY